MLNSFSLGGPEKYNSVAGFFYGLPVHILLGIETVMVWIPLAFHMVYGLFITARAQNNYFGGRYKWSHNRMYAFQRISGIFLMVFLIFHFCTTTLQVKLRGDNPAVVDYYAMQAQFSAFYYLILVFYVLGVGAASYHLSYGVWNFCIRWGIAVSEAAQARIQRFSFVLFCALTLLGWVSLLGFMKHRPASSMQVSAPSAISSTISSN